MLWLPKAYPLTQTDELVRKLVPPKSQGVLEHLNCSISVAECLNHCLVGVEHTYTSVGGCGSTWVSDVSPAGVEPQQVLTKREV